MGRLSPDAHHGSRSAGGGHTGLHSGRWYGQDMADCFRRRPHQLCQVSDDRNVKLKEKLLICCIYEINKMVCSHLLFNIIIGSASYLV